MWIELHDSSRDHPKILKVARDCGISNVLALGHMCSLWTWVLRMAPDGNLSSFDWEDIELAAQWGGEPGKLYRAMMDRTLLDDCDGVVSVHDWEFFSGSLKAADRVRKHRSRKRNVTKPFRNGTSNDVTQNDRPTERPNERKTDRPIPDKSSTTPEDSGQLRRTPSEVEVEKEVEKEVEVEVEGVSQDSPRTVPGQSAKCTADPIRSDPTGSDPNRPKEGVADEELVRLLNWGEESQTIKDTLAEIATTRKSGKISDSVRLGILRQLYRYREKLGFDIVTDACKVYLDKGCAAGGKGERYLYGIVRRESRDEDRAWGEPEPAEEIEWTTAPPGMDPMPKNPIKTGAPPGMG